MIAFPKAIFLRFKLLYSSENKLIIGLIAVKKDKETALTSQEIFKQKLDWSYILRTARQNGIATLFYENLRRFDVEEEVPSWVTQELKQIYHYIGFKNALFYDELGKVLHAFKNRGIDVIVLKGAVLAEMVWRNVALRQMGDLDLLVREQNLDKVDQTLSQLNYTSYEGYRPKTWYRRNHHHLAPYHNLDKEAIIEIHQNLVPPNNLFYIDVHRVWERAYDTKIGNVDTLVLSPEDLIVHLCLHLSYCNKFVGGIKHLIDISQVVRYYGEGINWDWIIKEANKNKFTKFIYYPLYLAKGILDVGIEKEILNRFKAQSNLRGFWDCLLKLIIKKNVFSKDESSSVFPTWFVRQLCNDLLCNDSTHLNIKYLMKTFFLPSTGPMTNISSLPLPRRICFYYPFLRFYKLISKLSRMIIKIAFPKTGIFNYIV
jgi:hypothetical protein